jgi:hypothetical protein
MINPEKIPTRESVKSSESVVELEVNLEEAAEKAGGWLRWIWEKISRKLAKWLLPLVILFPGLEGPARADDFSKILGKIAAVGTLVNALEQIANKNKKEKQEADEAYKKTKELNDLRKALEFLTVKLSGEEKRFAIDPNIRIIPYGYFPGANLDLPNLTKHLIGVLFSKLGLKQVGTLEDIKKTARERQELRAIPEVKQEQVPKPGTLEVPQFEINISVSILFNVKDIRKDVEVALRNIGFDLRKHLEKLGFKQAEFLSIFDSLRETKVIAIVVIDVLNLDNNEKISLIGIGTPYILEKISADIKRVLFVGGVEKSNIKKDDMAVVNSIASGVGNILLALEEEKQKKKEREGEKGKTEEPKQAAVFFVISIPKAEV